MRQLPLEEDGAPVVGLGLVTGGRKPTPTEEKRRNGNPGKRGMPQATLVGGRRVPARPPHLSAPMRSAWNVMVEDLEAGGVLDHADGGTIEAAAVFWGRAREARAELTRQAAAYRKGERELPHLMATTARGYTANPLIAIERESWGQFRLIAENLGLSPVARARLGMVRRAQGTPTSTMAKELDRKLGESPKLRVVGDGQ